jgi:hypothetical protein
MVLFQHFCHQRKYCSRTNKDIADVDSALTWDTDYVMYDTLDAWRTWNLTLSLISEQWVLDDEIDFGILSCNILCSYSLLQDCDIISVFEFEAYLEIMCMCMYLLDTNNNPDPDQTRTEQRLKLTYF